MLNIKIKYVSFLVCITGKMQETIETKAKTIKDLIKEIGKKYEGFESIFLPEEEGPPELRSVIYLRRKGKPPQGVISTEFELRDDDIYMFW